MYVGQNACLHLADSILVGPAVRGPSAFEPLDRYPLTDLTKPAPIFVRDLSVKENFTLGPGKKSSELRSKLAAALLPVPPRPTAKQMTASFGFFEQAFGRWYAHGISRAFADLYST